MAIDQVARQLAARALATRSMTAPEKELELDTTLTKEGTAPDSKVVGDAINKLKTKIFVGSKGQYQLAYEQGRVPIGAIVIITPEPVYDEDIDDDESSSILGTGVLGYMILGQ